MKVPPGLEDLQAAVVAMEEKEMHFHVCDNPECKFMWRHRASDIKDDKNDLAHKCPKCGQYQYWKLGGKGNPSCFVWTGVEDVSGAPDIRGERGRGVFGL